VVGFGAAKPPQVLYFLVHFAGFAGKVYEKVEISGRRSLLEPHQHMT
jgi:hypothetical protein